MKFQSYIKELEKVDFQVTYVFIEERINGLRPNALGMIDVIDILWMVDKIQSVNMWDILQKKESTKLLI